MPTTYDFKTLTVVTSGLSDSTIFFGAKEGQADAAPDPIAATAVAAYLEAKMSLSNMTTGTLAAARGGTGQSSYTIGDLLYASGATALSKLAAATAGFVLLAAGAATAPAWGSVSTALDALGSTQGQVLYRNASAWVALSPGTNGQFLQSQGAAANPQWVTVASGLTVGSTAIASGTNTRILYNNSGVLGEYTLTGTGTVVAMQTAPTLVADGSGIILKNVGSSLTSSAPDWYWTVDYSAGDNSDPADGLKNLVYMMGANVSAGGGRVNAALPSLHLSFETRYWLSAGTGPGMEWHLQSTDTAGESHRPITLWLPHTPAAYPNNTNPAHLSLLVDQINIGPYDLNEAGRITVSMRSASTTFSYPVTCTHVFGVNNTAIIQQINAAGSQNYHLAYLDNSDIWRFGTGGVTCDFAGPISITQGAITANAPQINGTATWNNAGVTFTGWKFNVTNTASAAASLLVDIQVGGSSMLSLSKSGLVTNGSGLTANTGFIWSSGSSFGALLGNNNGASGLQLGSAATVSWGGGSPSSSGQTVDLFLTRSAASSLQLGAADAAAPVAQSILVQSVVAGTADTAGANWTFKGSKSTGTGVPGDIIFQTAGKGAASTAQNTLITALTIKGGTTNNTNVGYPSVIIGNAALATNATDGFLYIPTCAGTPTGVPTAATGRVALIYDTTNKQFWIYDGAWLQPKTPAGAALVTWQ